jgi:hypothetical protein
MCFLHHALQHGSLPRKLVPEQVYQVDLSRKRQPAEVFAYIERSIRSIEIADRASLTPFLRLNRSRHTSTLPFPQNG